MTPDPLGANEPARQLPREPRWLTESILLALHAQQVERYGGAHGVLDQHIVLSALSRPINRWHDTPDCDVADLATVYLVGFASARGFRSGNRRPGLATGLLFVALNGAPVHAPMNALYALTMAVATNQADDTVVATALRGWLSPR
jgi:death-on-curing protein